MKQKSQLLVKKIKQFHSDSLYRNSVYLIISTLVAAGFGFLFWVVNTRIFTSEQIGFATALISTTVLLSKFSMLGLDAGVIRYLPKTLEKSTKINSVIITIIFFTTLLSLIYLAGIQYFSPKLSFITDNLFSSMIFILAVIFLSLDAIASNILISFRTSKYILIKNLVGSLIKLSLPFALVLFGTYAIFVSSSVSSVIGFIICFYILIKRFNYKVKLVIDKNSLLIMSKFSFGNYLASFVASLPLNLLPILITNNLGPKFTAYFYMDIMIINLLNVIQSSLAQSLFAEGSNNEKELKKYVTKSIKFTILAVIPSIILILLFGKYVLLAFGKEYSNEGIVLLNLLALSTIFTTVNGILSAILNIKGKINLILIMCGIGAVILLTLVSISVSKGLIALGYSWLIGEALISAIYLALVYYKFK